MAKGDADTKRSIVDIKNAIRGSKSPLATMASARAQVPPEAFESFVKWLGSVRHKGRPIFEHQFPRFAADLATGSLLSISIEKEILWASATLVPHAIKLNKFRKLACTYEDAILAGALQQALDVLSEIENSFGTSFWLIENKFATLQAAKGLEAQKSYLAEIRGQGTENTVAAYVAFYISNRNERVVNPQRLSDLLSARLSQSDVPSSIGVYLKFRLVKGYQAASQDIGQVLKIEAISSVVDCYEAFIRFAGSVPFHDEELGDIFVREAEKLSHWISEDIRLAKICLAYGSHECPHVPLRSTLSAENLFVRGDYSGSQISTLLSPSIWATEALAASVTGDLSAFSDGDSKSEIAKRAANVLTRTGEYSESTNELLYLAYNFGRIAISDAVDDFIEDNLVVKTGPKFERVSAVRAFISSATLDPEVLPHLPQRNRRQFAQCLCDSYGPQDCIAYYMLTAGFTDDDISILFRGIGVALSPECRSLAAIEASLRASDYAATISEAERASIDIQSPLFRERIEKFEAAALLQAGQIKRLCKFITSKCLATPKLADRFPIAACAGLLDKQTRKTLAAELCVSILLDLYCSTISDDLSRIRAYAYEDFLLAYGIERPSQLADRIVELSREELVYYLRYICIPEVMQNSSAFRGVRELESERLSVLAMLVKIDVNNAQDYEEETRKITRDQLIQRAVRDVEQSKIFVDISAISRWAEQNLRERFIRYKALRAAGVGAADKESLQRAIDSVMAGNPVPEQLLQLPTDEVTDLLLEIVRSLLRQCTSNSVHGLDCYLSMRIRHGTLSGQLRSPLEMEHLVTYRESGSNEYNPNVHWSDKLQTLGLERSGAIADRLAQFSSDYDSQIQWIANDLIQIWGSDKPNGWFKIFFSSLQIQALAVDIDKGIGFDEFIEICFKLFWSSLDDCLKDISVILERKIKPIFFAMLEELERDVHVLAGDDPTIELDRAIRTARSGVLQALDRIERWFKLPKATATPVSSFEDLLDVGLKGVTNIHPDFKPAIEKDFGLLPDLAHGLTLFSDIFFIIFDNIRRHSGASASPKVWIRVRRTERRLGIRIENQLSPGARTETSESKVESIRNRIERGDYQQSVRLEGGSGLIKLRKLIGGDQAPPLHLDFGFTDEERFFVELELSVTDVRQNLGAP